MMMLSPHFSVSEFEKSERAIQLGIRNKMSVAQATNARELCVYVLEKVREHFDKPVTISSGFRCQALNEAIRGAAISQHTEGKAADINAHGVDCLDVFRYIINNLDYDQCIYEIDGDSIWVHVSYNGKKNRRQSLKGERVKGDTIYTPFKG